MINQSFFNSEIILLFLKISITTTESFESKSFEESEENDLKIPNEFEQRNSLAAPINNFKMITKKLSSSQNCLNDLKKDIGFSLQIGNYQINELKRKSQADLMPHTISNLSSSLFNISTESSATYFSDVDGFEIKKISVVSKSELNGIFLFFIFRVSIRTL